MNVYNKYRILLQPLPDVPTLALDSCQLAVGVRDRSNLLSGLEIDAEIFLPVPGTANAKQLPVRYRVQPKNKVTDRREGCWEVPADLCATLNKYADGVPTIKLLALRTGGEGAVWVRVVAGSFMSKIMFMQGCVSDDLSDLLTSLPLVDAHKFHHLAACGMEKLGYWVKRNFVVQNRGDGRRGKIDIVAKRGDEVIAIELDHVEPRAKSLYKPRHGWWFVVMMNRLGELTGSETCRKF